MTTDVSDVPAAAYLAPWRIRTLTSAARRRRTAMPRSPPQDDKPTIRVAGLLIHEGSILMVEQERGDESYWLLPGGGVQFGETLADALRRELQEELGLRVGVQLWSPSWSPSRPSRTYAKHVVHLVFEVSAPAEALPEPQEAKVLNAVPEPVSAPGRRRTPAHRRVPERVRARVAVLTAISRPPLVDGVAAAACDGGRPRHPNRRSGAFLVSSQALILEHAIILVM